jgi:hypothetical protein
MAIDFAPPRTDAQIIAAVSVWLKHFPPTPEQAAAALEGDVRLARYLAEQKLAAAMKKVKR